MYRNLINSLSYMHSLLCRGKGIVTDAVLHEIVMNAHTLTAIAPEIERNNGTGETANDKAYLQEAKKIDGQIEEMYVFLTSLEIV